jgi:hypothetical protein
MSITGSTCANFAAKASGGSSVSCGITLPAGVCQ